jgi:hypothetical protein
MREAEMPRHWITRLLADFGSELKLTLELIAGQGANGDLLSPSTRPYVNSAARNSERWRRFTSRATDLYATDPSLHFYVEGIRHVITLAFTLSLIWSETQLTHLILGDLHQLGPVSQIGVYAIQLTFTWCVVRDAAAAVGVHFSLDGVGRALMARLRNLNGRGH